MMLATPPTSSGRSRDSLLSALCYPAQMPSLTTLFTMSACMLLTIAPVVGLLFQFVIWAAAYRYAVEVFERSAHGSSVAPEFAADPDDTGWRLLVLQLLFQLCLWWLDSRIETRSWRWLGIGVIALLQPAMTLSIALDRNFQAALDPKRLLNTITGLGATYALLAGAGIGLGAVQQIVQSTLVGGRAYVLVVVSGIRLGGALQVEAALLGNWLFVVIAQALAGFVWFYLTFTYFHGLGRIVYAHHEALGFTPIPETVLRPEDRHAPLMRRVDGLVEEQDLAGAARELGRCLATEPHTSPAMHTRYRQLLARIGDRAGLLAHARMRIDALLVGGSEREALSLLRESLAGDPQFRPASAERTTQLARAAERGGQYDLAMTLLGDFPQRHPRDPDIPANALVACRLLIERRSDVAGARAAITAALDRLLPAHPMYNALLERRKQLDKMGTSLNADASKNASGSV